MEAQQSVEAPMELEPLVGLFRLLADKTRVQVLLILARGERNVGSLCTELGLPQPTVSHHLGLLRGRSLIVNRRSGKQVYYGLDERVAVDSSGVINIRSESFNLRIEEPSADARQLPKSQLPN
jgi:DNA-binding transcriptional ArsR family regulator